MYVCMYVCVCVCTALTHFVAFSSCTFPYVTAMNGTAAVYVDHKQGHVCMYVFVYVRCLHILWHSVPVPFLLSPALNGMATAYPYVSLVMWVCVRKHLGYCSFKHCVLKHCVCKHLGCCSCATSKGNPR